MKILWNVAAIAAVAAALTIAPQARADIINFYLNQPECTGACGPGTAPPLLSNLASVEVTVNLTSSTGATITFTAPSGNVGAPVLLNVAGFFLASSTEPLAPSGPCGNYVGAPAQCAPGSEDHFGTMDLETGAVGHPTITVSLTAEDGNTWADAAAVLTPTTGFGSAYSHGFEAIVATGSNGVQDAGYFTPAPVPEPSSLAVFGAGLLGFAAAYRRRRKSNDRG